MEDVTLLSDDSYQILPDDSWQLSNVYSLEAICIWKDVIKDLYLLLTESKLKILAGNWDKTVTTLTIWFNKKWNTYLHLL